jgi:diguanylate cyclase (GGDEF)-like protein
MLKWKYLEDKYIMDRLFFLLVLLLIVCVAGCGSAPEQKRISLDSLKTYRDIPGVTEEEIAAIEALKANRSEIVYGTLLSTEFFPLPDGSHGGFTPKLCQLLTQLFDIPFVIKEFEWDALIAALDSKDIDFTGELTPTEERKTRYWMTYPIAARQLRIFTHADSEEVKTERDTDVLTIAFLEGTVTAHDIQNIYRTSFTTVEVGDYETAAAMIKSGEIHGFIEEAVADPAFAQYDFIRSQIFFPLVHSPVSMTTANPELAAIVSVVNKFIDYFTAGGEDLLFDLYQQGDFAYARHKLSMLLTEEEKAFIRDLAARNESIPVAFEYNNYPVIFYNEQEKEFQGIAADVLAEISKLVDIKFEPVDLRHFSWTEILGKLKTGEIPIAGEILITEPRHEHFIWGTHPYSRSYYTIISKYCFPDKASHQIARHSVGVLRDSGHLEVYRNIFADFDNLIIYDTFDECLTALETGEVELLMASGHILIALTHYLEKTEFKTNLRLPIPMHSHFGFAKNQTILRSIISKAQQFVPTDVIELRWTGRSFDYAKKVAEHRMKLMALFSGAVLLVLVAAVFLLIRTIRLGNKLKEIASKDALTDIFNRRYFMELATIQLERIARTKASCFIVIYDLDHFKSVNDTYGHLAGDKVLKETAQRVKAAIRPYDLFGRYGGEEFILLLSDVNAADAISAIERLRLTICSTPVKFEKLQIPVSASFGISEISQSNNMEAATKCADKALYLAKESGRNRAVFRRVEEHPSLFERIED